MPLAGLRAVALALTLLLGGGLAPGSAHATTQGVAGRSVVVGSAVYSAVVRAGTAAPLTYYPPETISAANDSFLSLTNNGTVPLSAAASSSVKITITLKAGNGPVELQTCSTGWNEANNTCSVTPIAVADSSAARTYPLATPLDVNAPVRVRLHNAALIKFGSQVTIDVSVSQA